ncbi:hypothetical protein, partial [Actinomadura latina]|uniref:hypothetical protein n=1 Tax=Actinomadura latina TaxID=163603 RepID=UPI001B3487AB
IRAITASRKPARRSSSACAIVPPTAAGFFTFVTQSNDHGGRLACPALHPIVITPGRPADQQHHPHSHDLQLPYLTCTDVLFGNRNGIDHHLSQHFWRRCHQTGAR